MAYIGEKKNAYQLAWMQKRRAKWFEGKVCGVCGTIEQLELDHVDPKLKVHHAIWSWSWKRIEEETAKCQVLCHQHHVEKTFANKEQARGEKHGFAKLTEQQAIELRKLRSEGMLYKDLADKFGLADKSCAWDVVNRKWQHLN